MEHFLTNFINSEPTILTIPEEFNDNIIKLLFPDENTINSYNNFVSNNKTDLPKTYDDLINSFKIITNENPDNKDIVNMYLTLSLYHFH